MLHALANLVLNHSFTNMSSNPEIISGITTYDKPNFISASVSFIPSGRLSRIFSPRDKERWFHFFPPFLGRFIRTPLFIKLCSYWIVTPSPHLQKLIPQSFFFRGSILWEGTATFQHNQTLSSSQRQQFIALWVQSVALEPID